MTLDKEEFKTLVMLYAAENSRIDLVRDLLAIIEEGEKCIVMEDLVVRAMKRLVK